MPSNCIEKQEDLNGAGGQNSALSSSNVTHILTDYVVQGQIININC